MRDIKLSIIMPLYNVEDTIRLALDSILMQIVNFNYEIITVDDCSTDNTLEILNEYAEKYPQIKIIKHEENQGNAIAFYNALSASNGDYFCVLDGDDYYTVKNKLQKQVDFLDGDKNEDYVAVTHKYLRVNSEGKIWKDRQLTLKEREHDYNDFLRQSFYYHTSTYMYRNIFRGNVPEVFKEPLMRGDNPRTHMHVSYTKGKVKFLDFVGSVYRYSENGIWSKTTPEAQRERNIKMFEFLRDLLPTELERNIYDEICKKRLNRPLIIPDKTNWLSMDFYLDRLRKFANNTMYFDKDFSTSMLYKSNFIDSFCESIGFVNAVHNGLTISNPLQKNENNILIINHDLISKGGGIYFEIKDIINIYPKKQVYLLLTNINSVDDMNKDIVFKLKKFKNLKLIFGQKNTNNKLKRLTKHIMEIRPAKIYHYCMHDNTFASALIQSMYSKNICVFSYDHGLSLALDNTSYDTYITKRPMDYEILTKNYGSKVIYIPCWNEDKSGEKSYTPFKNHTNIITACGAARYYKLKGAGYINLIVDLLSKTNGKHFHYGPIEENELKTIQNKLVEKNIDKNKFIHIPWADNIAQSIIENDIDIFIEPFPVVSYKLTLDILSAGIPVFIHNAKTRMSITDFIYKNSLKWNNKEDFIEILSTIDAETLLLHSKFSREYYTNNHTISKNMQYFIQEQGFDTPATVSFFDNHIVDLNNIRTIMNIELNLNTNNNKKNCSEKKLKLIEKIFSITNIENKKRKLVTLLGIKIKIKRGVKA